MSSKLDFYCPDVFKSVYLRRHQDDKIAVGFCCQSSLDDCDPAQLGATMEQRRLRWLQTKGRKDCDSCLSLEDRGGSSRRHASIELFDHLSVTRDQSPEVLNVEWNCRNTCNLACITCGPIFSSKWAMEIKRYGWQDDRWQGKLSRDQSVLSMIDWSRVRRIYFNGGEPLLTDDPKMIMRQLRSHNQLESCEISLNTNCTVLPDQETLDLWSQSRMLRLFLSIDATEELFEFVRWPARWPQVLDFIELIKAQPFNIIMDITCTVGIHNVFYLDQLRQWQQQYLPCNHQQDPVSLNLQPCGAISVGGEALSLRNISHATREKVARYCETHGFDEVKNWLPRQPQPDDDAWIQYLDTVSAVRDQDWRRSIDRLCFS